MKKWMLLVIASICMKGVFAKTVKIENDSERDITIVKIYATSEDFDDTGEKLASSSEAKKLKCSELPLTLHANQSKSLRLESPAGYEEGMGIVYTYMKDGKKMTSEASDTPDGADGNVVEFCIDFDDELDE